MRREDHRPRRGREQGDRDERHRAAEARTENEVRECDCDDREDGDRRGREERAVVDRDDDGDDVDVEGRIGRAGARRQTHRAYVAVEDVVRDAQRDRLVVVERHEPEVPQPQPGGEREDCDHACRFPAQSARPHQMPVVIGRRR